VHRADVLELVRPLGGVRRVRQEGAVHERVDLGLLEQRRELAVDRRLGEVELDELDLAADLRGGPDVERDHPLVPGIFFEPAQQLPAEERARPGHRDDAAVGGGAGRHARCL
jgi:hypothetical protein